MPETNGAKPPVAEVVPNGNQAVPKEKGQVAPEETRQVSAEENRRVTPEGDRPSPSQASGAIPPDLPTVGDERPSKKDRPKSTDWALVAFTLALVLVGVLQWQTFNKQWREMVSGGNDTHELAVAAAQQAKASEAQANEAQAQVEKLTESLHKTDLLLQQETAQARSTQLLAANSKSSLKAAQEGMKLAERAWVGVQTEVLSTYASGKHIRAQVNLLNTGKSPALKITYTANLAVLKRGEEPTFLFDWQLNNWSGVHPIPPQAGYQITVSEKGGVLSDDDKARIDRQENIVWVWGTIQYEDIFNDQHTTKYCAYTLDPTTDRPIPQGKLLSNCPEYSEMD